MENNLKIKIVIDGNTKEIKILQGQFGTLEKDIKKAEKQTKSFQDRMLNLGKMTVGVYALARAFSSVTRTVGALISDYKVQEQAEAKLKATLEATGNAAGYTAKELVKFAGELQNLTTYGDEATIGMMSVLNTFKEISGETYKRTVRAVQDVSTVMGQDLQSSAVQVGKALNDPIKGVAALGRVGIQFSEDQKRLIKSFAETNQVAKAQEIILKELESQFGGASEAIAKTATGSLTQLANKYGDLRELMGKTSVEAMHQSGLFGLLDDTVGDLTDGLNASTLELGFFVQRATGGLQMLKNSIELVFGTTRIAFKETSAFVARQLSDLFWKLRDTPMYGDFFRENAMRLNLDFNMLKEESARTKESMLKDAKEYFDGFDKLSMGFEEYARLQKRTTEEAQKTTRRAIGLQSEDAEASPVKAEDFRRSLQVWQNYFETIGDYESAWAIRSAQIWEENSNVLGEERTNALLEKLKGDFFGKVGGDVDFSKQKNAFFTYYKETGQMAEAWVLRQEEIMEEFSALIGEDRALELAEAMKKNFFEPTQDDAQKTANAIYEAFNGAARQMENSFMNFFDATNKEFGNFGALAKNILRDVMNQIIRMQVVAPMVSGITSIFGGMFAQGGVFQGGQLIPAYAHGGAFHNGVDVTPFANGGVVSSPTFFPMAKGMGLMGEAGAEAIMPLTRIGGDLGVKAVAGNTYINVENKSGVNLDMSILKEQTDSDGNKTLSVLLTAIERNPDVRQAIKGIR